MQGRNRFVWLVYLIFGTVAVATYALIPAGPDHARLVTGLVGVSMVLMMALGVYVHRPRASSAWLLLAAGLLAFALGNIFSAYQEHAVHGSPFLSIAGICYLSGYPLFWAGLALFIHARAPKRNWTAIIDTAAITTTVALAFWLFVASPIVHDQTLTSAERAISLAYPLGAVILLATASRISMGANRRPPAYWFLGVGIVMLVISDSAYLETLRTGGLTSGGVIDLAWLGSYLLCGTAALHPSMQTLSLPMSERLPRLTPRRLVLLACAAIAAPAMLTVQYIRGAGLDIPVVVGSSALLVLLVLARTAVIVHGHETHGVELEKRGARCLASSNDTHTVIRSPVSPTGQPS